MVVYEHHHDLMSQFVISSLYPRSRSHFATFSVQKETWDLLHTPREKRERSERALKIGGEILEKKKREYCVAVVGGIRNHYHYTNQSLTCHRQLGFRCYRIITIFNEEYELFVTDIGRPIVYRQDDFMQFFSISQRE